MRRKKILRTPHFIMSISTCVGPNAGNSMSINSSFAPCDFAAYPCVIVTPFSILAEGICDECELREYCMLLRVG